MKLCKFAPNVAIWLLLVRVSNGLQCYQCLHLDYKELDADGSEKSCSSGKTPDKKFIVTCGAPTVLNDTNSNAISVKALCNTPPISNGQNPSQNPTWACGKAAVDGKADGNKFKFTFRGCIADVTGSTEMDVCTEDSIQSVAEGASLWSEFAVKTIARFAGESVELESSSKFSGCACTSDECNKAVSIRSDGFIHILVGCVLFYNAYNS